jgi:hypothetical protein
MRRENGIAFVTRRGLASDQTNKKTGGVRLPFKVRLVQLKRNDSTLNWYFTLASLFEHDLFRKPVSTFRDHALAERNNFLFDWLSFGR